MKTPRLLKLEIFEEMKIFIDKLKKVEMVVLGYYDAKNIFQY